MLVCVGGSHLPGGSCMEGLLLPVPPPPSPPPPPAGSTLALGLVSPSLLRRSSPLKLLSLAREPAAPPGPLLLKL